MLPVEYSYDMLCGHCAFMETEMGGWRFTDAVESLIKKVKPVGSLKTSRQLAEEKYYADQKRIEEKAQAENNLEFVVEDSVRIQREQITRMLKCKSLFTKEFVDAMMRRDQRDSYVVTNRWDVSCIRAGYMTAEGYAVGIEVEAHYRGDFTMTFGYTHDVEGEMHQVIGPMPFDQIVALEYPKWFRDIING